MAKKSEEELELETLEGETVLVESLLVDVGQLTEAEIESRYQAHLEKIQGGK